MFYKLIISGNFCNKINFTNTILKQISKKFHNEFWQGQITFQTQQIQVDSYYNTDPLGRQKDTRKHQFLPSKQKDFQQNSLNSHLFSYVYNAIVKNIT